MTAATEEAAGAFGGSHPLLISKRENAVYKISSPPGRAALRLHRPGYQSEAAIRSELWLCEALASRGFPVARPIPAPGGEFLVTLANGQLASAVGWVDGQPIGEAGVALGGSRQAQIELHAKLGRLLARLHDATEALDLPPWFIRPHWDIKGLVGETPFWGRFWEHPAMSQEEMRLARKARDFLRARLEGYGAEGSGRLIHADVVRENVFSGPDGLWLIDFDDSGFGFPLYDLGTAMSQNLSEPALPDLAEALVAGYSETRMADPEIVLVFTLMRCCASVGWMMPRLAPGDPTIRRYIDRALGLAQAMLQGRKPW